MSPAAERLARLWSLPPFWRPTSAFTRPPDFFDRRQLRDLRGWTQRMAHFDPQLSQRLLDRRLRGLKGWEYGNLMSLLAARPASKSWSVLDVGPGESAMPFFLAGHVGRVTTIDYVHALEPMSDVRRRSYRSNRMPFVCGSMLELPFGAHSFDLVTCISTIEHLDDRGGGRQSAYDEFLERTRCGLRELVRVLRPGGYLYLTTDAYIPELQPIDAWSRKRPPGNVRWSIYRMEDVAAVFLDEIAAAGIELMTDGDFDAERLVRDENRSSYRGRYCTTFIVYGRKTPGVGSNHGNGATARQAAAARDRMNEEAWD